MLIYKLTVGLYYVLFLILHELTLINLAGKNVMKKTHLIVRQSLLVLPLQVHMVEEDMLW